MLLDVNFLPMQGWKLLIYEGGSNQISESAWAVTQRSHMRTIKYTSLRILLFPIGFVLALIRLGNSGSRDIFNWINHLGATVDQKCRISGSTISENAHILENCYFMSSSIKPFSYIGRNCFIQNSDIGSFCSIASDVLMGLGSHPYNYFSTSPLFYRKRNTFKIQNVKKDLEFQEYKRISIGNDVWIGARAIILDGVNVGDGAVVAANSVVTKSVPPYAIVGGNPAKILKYRFTEDKIQKLLDEKWWLWPLDKINNRINNLNV